MRSKKGKNLQKGQRVFAFFAFFCFLFIYPFCVLGFNRTNITVDMSRRMAAS
jgi:hypothetical protein